MKAELLAPAGSYESMTAAIAAGADAVYIGGSRFGARAYAENPDEDLLKRAIDYAHVKKRRLYLTVNTLLKDAELEELYDYLNPYYREGLDAVIVQDLGVLRYIRDVFPGLDIHASTQMGITGAYGARFLKELGATRIVTARELSLEEIRGIHESTDIEIESFIHGALCFCYSGQCLLSSMIGGRSGNRGRCAQPCRLPYDLYENGKRLNKKEKQYLLSPKDICTLELLPQLIESGVYSMKIEGRMKRPEYAAGVVRIYRRYLDRYLEEPQKKFQVSREDRQELLDLYSRGGFSDGYYRRHNGTTMMSPGQSNYCTDNEKLLQEIKRQYLDRDYPEKINGKLILSKRKPAILSLSYDGHTVTAEGMQPQKALSRPLTTADLEKQMRKTGGSGFVLEQLDIDAEEDVFLPMQALNELRRNAIAALKEDILACSRRPDGVYRRPASPAEDGTYPKTASLVEDGTYQKTASLAEDGTYRRPASLVEDGRNAGAMHMSASAEDLALVETLCAVPEIDAIYLDCGAFSGREDFLADSQKWIEICHAAGKKCFYIMPWIFRAQALAYYRGRQAQNTLALYDGLLIRNQEEYAFLREHAYPKELAADWNLYTWNREARLFWKERRLARDTAPVELNRRELARRGLEGSELIVYGYQPLMVSAQCQKKNSSGCTKRPSLLYLKDRKQKYFAVKNVCPFCYNVLYNSAPLELSGNAEDIRRLHPAGIRLQFTAEDARTAGEIAQIYVRAFFRGEQADRAYKEFTRGHFERGVE